MKRYILYTTEAVSQVQTLADFFAADISKTEGRGEVSITVLHHVPYKKDVKIITDHDKHRVFDWRWFGSEFKKGHYEGVIFHFTPKYRSLWGITQSINGSRNKSNLEYPEFWLCCKLNAYAEGYERLPEFMRLMYHEHAHFDEDLDNSIGNKLTQNTVHDMDYKLKKIHLYHLLVDYRGKGFKETVAKIINRAVFLMKQYVSNT